MRRCPRTGRSPSGSHGVETVGESRAAPLARTLDEQLAGKTAQIARHHRWGMMARSGKSEPITQPAGSLRSGSLLGRTAGAQTVDRLSPRPLSSRLACQPASLTKQALR